MTLMKAKFYKFYISLCFNFNVMHLIDSEEMAEVKLNVTSAWNVNMLVPVHIMCTEQASHKEPFFI